MPDLDREVGEGEDIGSGGVGLVIERVEHGLDCWPQTLRSDRYQSGRVVSAVTLSRCSGQIRRDRVDQAGVSIRGDQMDSPSGGGQPDQCQAPGLIEAVMIGKDHCHDEFEEVSR